MQCRNPPRLQLFRPPAAVGSSGEIFLFCLYLRNSINKRHDCASPPSDMNHLFWHVHFIKHVGLTSLSGQRIKCSGHSLADYSCLVSLDTKRTVKSCLNILCAVWIAVFDQINSESYQGNLFTGVKKGNESGTVSPWLNVSSEYTPASARACLQPHKVNYNVKKIIQINKSEIPWGADSNMFSTRCS